jgi:hypothetical protein
MLMTGQTSHRDGLTAVTVVACRQASLAHGALHALEKHWILQTAQQGHCAIRLPAMLLNMQSSSFLL